MATPVGAVWRAIERFVSGGPSLFEIADVIHLRVAPRQFLRRHIFRLHRQQIEILLVGTLHWGHLHHPRLGLGLLKNLIDYYAPDRIGIEARPRDLEQGLVSLAPIDMVYVSFVAKKERGIAVYGFDYWEEREYEAIVAHGEAPNFNSLGRNDRMVELLLAETRTGIKHLVFTGYSHIKPFRERLMAEGFRPALLSSSEISRLLPSQRSCDWFSPSLSGDLERAISYLDRYLELQPEENAWTRRVRRKCDRLSKLVRTKAPVTPTLTRFSPYRR